MELDPTWVENFKKVIDDLKEKEIREYRLFYVQNLQDTGALLSVYRSFNKYLQALERRPDELYDKAFYELTNSINDFITNTFSQEVMTWFNDEVPAVKKIKETGSMLSFRLMEMSWIQQRTKLRELEERLRSRGLHPDISKRDPQKYGRYNVIIEFRDSQEGVNRYENRNLLSRSELNRLVLSPHKLKKTVLLNGTFIQPKYILRHTITECLLSDEEVPLFRIKHNCKDDTDFCEAFPKVTDDLLANIHLDAADPTSNPVPPFIAQSRIDELKAKTSTTWDFRKLIRLCEEINSSAQHENFFAILFLLRALMDHVPPIFGQTSFDAVANSYAGPKSFKKTMIYLQQTLKPIADLQIHRQISGTEPLPTLSQIDFKPKIDMLLDEILRISWLAR